MSTQSPMRILVVEDEPVSREALCTRLMREPGVEIVGEAADGESAIAAILALRPDVVFLDIQIPGPDGFGVLEAVAEVHLPAVVFVTAYDQFAIQAFDVHPLDYLLKPVDQQRVQRALNRARNAIADGADAAHHRLADFLSSMPGQNGARPTQRFVVRRGDSYHLVPVDRIDWIEAEGNYVRLHVGTGTELMRATLRELEKALDPDRFVRIHRGTIVAIDRVVAITPSSHGDGTVTLTTGAKLRMSRSYRWNLMGA